jgi:4-hydroxybenzoate polyprenyltransferase
VPAAAHLRGAVRYRRALELIVGLLQVVRPLTCLGAALLTVSGAYLAAESGAALSPAVGRATLLAGLAAAACNALNDYHDVAADRVNQPRRPIPAGRLPRPAAGAWAALLATLALALAWSLGPRAFIFALGLALLGAAYSYFFKNTVLLGNGLVGLLCGAALAYGAWVRQAVTPAAGLAAAGVAAFVCAREVLGTVLDQPGDSRVGLNTVATRWGRRAALRWFCLLAVAFVALCLAPWVMHWAPDGYRVAVVITGALPVAAIVVGLSVRSSEPAIRAARWIMKAQWFAGLLAIVWLR